MGTATTDCKLTRYRRNGEKQPPTAHRARKQLAETDLWRELRRQGIPADQTTLDDGRERFTFTLPTADHRPIPQIQITIGRGGIAEIRFTWIAHRMRPMIPGTWKTDFQADTELGTFPTLDAAYAALDAHYKKNERDYERDHELTPPPADYPPAGSRARYLRAFNEKLEALEGAIGTVTSEYYHCPEDPEENAVVAQFDWTPYGNRLTLDLIQEGEEWERVK